MVRIINFHGVGAPKRQLEPGEEPYWISETFFLQILDQVALHIGDKGQEVRLTFDDGNVSDIEIGASHLNDRSLTASFFVLSGRLNLAGSLSTGSLNKLVDMGHEVGTHGHVHRDWRQLNQTETQEEFAIARAMIEDAAGIPITSAAIPFGAYNRKVLRTLKHHDYKTVYSSDAGATAPNAWLKPRWSVRSDHKVEDVTGFLSGNETLWAFLRREAGMLKKRLL